MQTTEKGLCRFFCETSPVVNKKLKCWSQRKEKLFETRFYFFAKWNSKATWCTTDTDVQAMFTWRHGKEPNVNFVSMCSHKRRGSLQIVTCQVFINFSFVAGDITTLSLLSCVCVCFFLLFNFFYFKSTCNETVSDKSACELLQEVAVPCGPSHFVSVLNWLREIWESLLWLCSNEKLYTSLALASIQSPYMEI